MKSILFFASLMMAPNVFAAQVTEGEALKVINVRLESPKENAQFRLTQEITRKDCNQRGFVGSFKLANKTGETATTLIVADFAIRSTQQDCPLENEVTETIVSDWYPLTITDRLLFKVIVPADFKIEVKSDLASANQ